MTWILSDGSELTEMPSGKPEGFVYWIHFRDHTTFDSGYIGVSIDPISRYKSHLRDAFKDKHCNPYLAKIIRKYENELIVSVIYAGEIEECYSIELSLRPSHNIGWNLNIGGTRPPDRTGIPYTENHRQNISKSKLGVPRPPIAEETRIKNVRIKKGYGN